MFNKALKRQTMGRTQSRCRCGEAAVTTAAASKEDEGDDNESDKEGEIEENEEAIQWNEKRWTLEEQTREAVEKYLNDPRPANRLDTRFRKHIRDSAKNCPEAAKACYELSRDILVTKSSLLKCIYYQTVDKSCRKWDGPDGKGPMTGTPYESTDPSTVSKAEEVNGAVKAAGGIVYAKHKTRVSPSGQEICDCGCLVEDAIWGLYLWKTGRIEYEGRSEGYNSPPHPRTCGFAIASLKTWGICLDHIWMHEWDPNGTGYRRRSEQEPLRGLVLHFGQMLHDRGGAASLVGLEGLLSFNSPKMEE
ncbi:hypothetical protein AAF712_015507 [Marasmius tenuissimus]|uniref:Uncharacterized protein n=1 Tax=Marasmius tenuissimus TaxID=585030 RepID=A0ABR2Z953_9AGAR